MKNPSILKILKNVLYIKELKIVTKPLTFQVIVWTMAK